MRITITLDHGTEAFSLDAAGEVTAMLERVGELILERMEAAQDTPPESVNLFDTDSDTIGQVRLETTL
jgi:hypothetical protein